MAKASYTMGGSSGGLGVVPVSTASEGNAGADEER